MLQFSDFLSKRGISTSLTMLEYYDLSISHESHLHILMILALTPKQMVKNTLRIKFNSNKGFILKKN